MGLNLGSIFKRSMWNGGEAKVGWWWYTWVMRWVGLRSMG